MLDLTFPLSQSLAQSMLEAALKRGHLASAYLLSGPRGVGKATAARWLAAQILGRHLERGRDLQAQQRLLLQIQAGTCPDLVWVEPCYLVGDKALPQSQADLEVQSGIAAIRMDQALALRQLLQATATRGWWVVVVEEADLLTPEAGNALLKLLEDRRRCTFILTAQHEERVLDTIRSRSQRLSFGPLNQASYQEVLQRHCSELLQHPPLLHYGAGSPGVAMQTYRLLARLARECPQIRTFQPQSLAEGVLLGLAIARAVSRQPLLIQRTGLRYLQHHLAIEGQRAALPLFEQALTLIEDRLQPQGVWELLLSQCAQKGLSWQIQLPQLAPAAPKPNTPAEQVAPLPIFAAPKTSRRGKKEQGKESKGKSRSKQQGEAKPSRPAQSHQGNLF